MNNNPEAIQKLLSWLLQEPSPTVSVPSGEIASHGAGPDESGVGDPQFDELDPLDSEDISLTLSHPNGLASSNGSRPFSFEERPSFELGDISAVQERFYALIKRRLSAEIERNPPLFPWETDICDYEAEVADWISPELVPIGFWAAQLQHLNLPVPMPEQLLQQLLTQCQGVVQSSLREGMKLVQAVESLFPDQSQALNQLAGLVLASPARSGAATLANRTGSGFPSTYDTATPAQQMALSLLAAREILSSLTLVLSPSQPTVEKQWLTEAGLVTLRAIYPTLPGGLRIQAELPCAGCLQLQGQATESTAQRVTPGIVSVEMFDWQPGQTYPLEIHLGAPDQQPLRFAVRPVLESE